MQSYDDYFAHAKISTDIHARPSPTQQEIIDKLEAKEAQMSDDKKQ